MRAGTSASGHARLSRPARVARAAAGAAAASLLAAASHGLAGGEVTAFAVLATAVLSWPLCLALAGRLGSLWRLTAAVSVSQFVYHWSFAGLGVASGSPDSGAPAPLHAHHVADAGALVPAFAEAGAADAMMWLAHAVSAMLTILLLHRGERAVLGLLALIRRSLPSLQQPSALFPQRPARALPLEHNGAPLRSRLFSLAGISHRGPPLLPAP